jgi:hypothetical protein
MGELTSRGDARSRGCCRRCTTSPWPTELAHSYTYVLGQYLGDGHLVTSARVPVLRIYVCTDYPAVTELVVNAVRSVRGTVPGLVTRANSAHVAAVQSYWTHWPCLLPQHGPGYKHRRRITLMPWQRELAVANPWPLVRGLMHSDGCRSENRIVSKGRSYSYPRYTFANESRDILAIMGWALDLVGAEWRYNRPNSISIAQRASVALLDEHIGPKR